jgi:hypothetical protein
LPVFINERSRLTLMDMPSWLYKGQESAGLPAAECEILGIVGILRLDEG